MEEQVEQTTVWLMRLHIFEVAVQIGHMQPTYMNWATLKVGYLGKALNLGCAELSGQPRASSH